MAENTRKIVTAAKDSREPAERLGIRPLHGAQASHTALTSPKRRKKCTKTHIKRQVTTS